MVNRFLRTASTQRLLATLAGIVVAVAGGSAIAVAATSGGPVPKPERLPVAIHQALTAKPVKGISADVKFTNNLFPSFEIQGSDPLLTGGRGHIWVTNDGRFRLELYGDNGDPEIVLNHGSWWIYDPTLNAVYQGKLAQQGAETPKEKQKKSAAPPSVSQIQTELNHLASHLTISGAIPSDVGGQPTFTVELSPKSSAGLIGQLQVAWDAIHGVPLRFAVYARGDSNPALEFAATGVSYGTIGSNVFSLRPPSGAHITTVAMPTGSATTESKSKAHRNHAEATGIKAVARQLPFKLAAPSQAGGLARQSVSLLGTGQHRGALVLYGKGLGAVAVIENAASAGGQKQLNLSSGSGDHANGLMLPTVSINGATGQQLDTALGTILRFTSGGVSYTVLGSVRPNVADAVARGL